MSETDRMTVGVMSVGRRWVSRGSEIPRGFEAEHLHPPPTHHLCFSLTAATPASAEQA